MFKFSIARVLSVLVSQWVSSDYSGAAARNTLICLTPTMSV